MAALLIGVPIALIVLAGFGYLLLKLLGTALGFNGLHAMGRFYWSLLLVALWLAITVGMLAFFFAMFLPILDYFGNRDSKGGALGPAIVIPLMLICLVSAPVVATKVAASLNRLKGKRKRHAPPAKPAT